MLVASALPVNQAPLPELVVPLACFLRQCQMSVTPWFYLLIPLVQYLNWAFRIVAD